MPWHLTCLVAGGAAGGAYGRAGRSRKGPGALRRCSGLGGARPAHLISPMTAETRPTLLAPARSILRVQLQLHLCSHIHPHPRHLGGDAGVPGGEAGAGRRRAPALARWARLLAAACLKSYPDAGGPPPSGQQPGGRVDGPAAGAPVAKVVFAPSRCRLAGGHVRAKACGQAATAAARSGIRRVHRALQFEPQHQPGACAGLERWGPAAAAAGCTCVGGAGTASDHRGSGPAGGCAKQSGSLAPAAHPTSYDISPRLLRLLAQVGFYQITKIAVAPAVLAIEAVLYGKRATPKVGEDGLGGWGPHGGGGV